MKGKLARGVDLKGRGAKKEFSRPRSEKNLGVGSKEGRTSSNGRDLGWEKLKNRRAKAFRTGSLEGIIAVSGKGMAERNSLLFTLNEGKFNQGVKKREKR